MGRIKARDTRPEMRVRRRLHALGLRYRLHANDLPGKPDIVFRRQKLAIFVHGCFWHRHEDPACRLARLPKSRPEFWTPKLDGNRFRDRVQQEKLRTLGWRVVVVWECQMNALQEIESAIVEMLR